MKLKTVICLLGILFFQSCQELEEEYSSLYIIAATIGNEEIPLQGDTLLTAPIDRPIQLEFSKPLSSVTIEDNIILKTQGEVIPYNFNLFSNGTLISLSPSQPLKTGTLYQIQINEGLQSSLGQQTKSASLYFQTGNNPLTINKVEFIDSKKLLNGRITDVALSPNIEITFSEEVDPDQLEKMISIEGMSSGQWEVDKRATNTYNISFKDKLEHFKKYTFTISNELLGLDGAAFSGASFTFYTGAAPESVMPFMDDESLLHLVQEKTFGYFWEFGHEASGMARERNTSGNLVTTGGSGFGVMAMIVGVERGFITRDEAIKRWQKVLTFLENADRFHGAWPHWLDGNTGKTIPFSNQDDGGDLVETALLLQGLLTVRSYLSENVIEENELRERILNIYKEVEWSWYTRDQNVLYWHWSPNVNWAMNLPIQGYNECLITYILAAASPSYPISKSVYETGWARGGAMVNGSEYYGIPLPLGKDLGGPLFFAHYSYLGVDPRNLSDQYANYWEQNINHSRINQAYVMNNPKSFVGYSESNWGLTASDNENGYSAHSPLNDRGVITPTAALSSMPYTPEESLQALRFFYFQLGDRLWGEYGFYDAFNLTEDWYASSYLAIDQGPIIIMIENYRSGLLWDLMHKNEIFQKGLKELNFNY